MADELETLKLERADAWYDYLYVTRRLVGVKYERAESWAWARLRERLRMLDGRERKARQPAA